MRGVRQLGLSVVLSTMVASITFAEKGRTPPPAPDAATCAMRDTHAGVVIAAIPGDTKAARPDTRLDYFRQGMMPVRVVVTNNTDKDVDLGDARIDFIASDNTVVRAASLDDLERRFFTEKSATGTKLPIGPIPITVGKKDFRKKIEQDDQDFGFATTTVKPHTTVAGWLYYDMQQAPVPFLEHATLELREVHFGSSKDVLDRFEIELQAAEKSEEPR